MTSVKSAVGLMMPPKVREKLRERFVAMNVTHLHGPRAVRLSQDEAVVTCVLKNGEYYIESFIKHYLRMGFRHIFFMDNGSSDQTCSIAKSYDNVSICQCTLPIGSHQRLFKKYLSERVVRGGWCLDADIDEFFDYPFSDAVDLNAFLTYLNRHNHTAVMTQLLDMFSDKPLSHLVSEQKEDVRMAYQYYDVSDITKTDYRTSTIVTKYGYANQLADSGTALYWGGVRKALYGNDCLLTKHSLFLPGAGLRLFPHVHFVNEARLADVAGVMLHYKLTSNAMAMALQNRDNFRENSRGYSAFIDVLSKKPNWEIKAGTSQKFVSATELAKAKFLSMSPSFEEYAMTRASSSLHESTSAERRISGAHPEPR